jgi:deoxyribonuclease-4
VFGAHLSIAGGLHRAIETAARMRMDCVQVFTASPQQWRAAPLRVNHIDAWLDAIRAVSWHTRRAGARIVAHNSYLINLASPDARHWERSIAAQRDELARCESLAIPCCVIHPGAHLGASLAPGDRRRLDAPTTADEARGLRRIIAAINRLHRDLPGHRTITCLETTAGSGTHLGYAFHHLAAIRGGVREPERVAFCLDTCHVTAAGYDMSTDADAADMLRLFDEVCGLSFLRVVHVNDSRGARGSRLDRHAHIGEGRCGRACFRAIVNCRRLRHVPKILETPKGLSAGGTPLDLINLRRLKRLMGVSAAGR